MTDDDNTPPTFIPSEESMRVRVARLEHHQEQHGHQIESLTASRDTGRRLLWLVIPALVGALATALVFAAEKIAAAGERAGRSEAEMAALREQITQQRDDIRELRAALRRQSGADDAKPTSGPDWGALDKLSRLDQGRPASGSGTASGLVALHWPKLQNLQLGTRDVHSMLLLQIRPQLDGGGMTTTSDDVGASAGDVVQARIDAIRTDRSIPNM